MNPIPGVYRALAGIIAVLAIVAGLYLLGRHDGAESVQAEWSKERLAIAQAAIESDRLAREKEQGWQSKYQGAIDERTKTETHLAAARAAASAADERLRRASGDFQHRVSSASIEAARSAAGTAAGLLEECSGRYRAVAEAADGHLADLRQCEGAWPE